LPTERPRFLRSISITSRVSTTNSGTRPVTRCSSHFVGWRLRSCGQRICSAEWEVKSSRACYWIQRGKTPSNWQSGCVPRSKPSATRSHSNRLPRQSALASQLRTMQVLISLLCCLRQIRRSIARKRWVAIVSSFRRFHHSRLLLGKHLARPLLKTSTAFYRVKMQPPGILAHGARRTATRRGHCQANKAANDDF
jgi:hypothetical protein